MASTYLFNAYHPGSAFGENGSPWKFRFLENKWKMHGGQDYPALLGTPIPGGQRGQLRIIFQGCLTPESDHAVTHELPHAEFAQGSRCCATRGVRLGLDWG